MIITIKKKTMSNVITIRALHLYMHCLLFIESFTLILLKRKKASRYDSFQ